MAIDERIEDLGYKLVSYNNIIGTFIYENQDNNQRVHLFITTAPGAETRGVLYTETISTTRNFLGKNTTMPIGLSFAECRAFLDKADEIKNSMK